MQSWRFYPASWGALAEGGAPAVGPAGRCEWPSGLRVGQAEERRRAGVGVGPARSCCDVAGEMCCVLDEGVSRERQMDAWACFTGASSVLGEQVDPCVVGDGG